jgi:hypothetical protein
MCVNTTLNRLVEFHEIWYGGNAIHGDLDAIVFNLVDSMILKLLSFKFVRRALLNGGFGLFMFHGSQVVYCNNSAKLIKMN